MHLQFHSEICYSNCRACVHITRKLFTFKGNSFLDKMIYMCVVFHHSNSKTISPIESCCTIRMAFNFENMQQSLIYMDLFFSMNPTEKKFEHMLFVFGFYGHFVCFGFWPVCMCVCSVFSLLCDRYCCCCSHSLRFTHGNGLYRTFFML